MNPFKFIKTWWYNRKLIKSINQIYLEDQILDKFQILFQNTIQWRWHKRSGIIYGVIHPILHIPAEERIFDPLTDEISQYQIEKFLYSRLEIIQKFIQHQELWDVLSIRVEPISDSNGQFLIKISPILG